MTAAQDPRFDPGADAEAIVSGALGKELGVSARELALGLDVAKNYLKRGAGGEAMQIYATLVLCEPANVEFQVGLANCALQIGESHLALQSASAVIALAPRDPRGYLLSGRACLALGQADEAIEDFGDAVTFGREARKADLVQEAQSLLQKVAATRDAAGAH